MVAGHVPFGQPDGVSLLAANGNFLANEGDDRPAALVVHDDQLQQGGTRRKVYSNDLIGVNKGISSLKKTGNCAL